MEGNIEFTEFELNAFESPEHLYEYMCELHEEHEIYDITELLTYYLEQERYDMYSALLIFKQNFL